MDKNKRIDFLNSVQEKTQEKKRFCGQCGEPVSQGAQFCRACGATLSAGPKTPSGVQNPKQVNQAFAPVDAPAQAKNLPASKAAFTPADAPAQAPHLPRDHQKAPYTVPQTQDDDPAAFAKGLPAWDLTPPMLVERKGRK